MICAYLGLVRPRQHYVWRHKKTRTLKLECIYNCCKTTSSVFHSEMIAKLEMPQRTVSQKSTKTCADLEGRAGGPPPCKITKLCGSLAILVQILWKITKLPSQHSMLSHYQPANETPFSCKSKQPFRELAHSSCNLNISHLWSPLLVFPYFYTEFFLLGHCVSCQIKTEYTYVQSICYQQNCKSTTHE